MHFHSLSSSASPTRQAGFELEAAGVRFRVFWDQGYHIPVRAPSAGKHAPGACLTLRSKFPCRVPGLSARSPRWDAPAFVKHAPSACACLNDHSVLISMQGARLPGCAAEVGGGERQLG